KRRFGWMHRSFVPQTVSAFAGKLRSRRWYHSPLAYALASGCIVMLGVETEYRMDVYGMRRPEGPYPLKVVDNPELIAKMMQVSEPIREEDKFLAFDIGSGFVSGFLVNRRNTFSQGEKL